MSRKRNLRSVFAQCRNLSSSRSSKGSEGTRFLIKGTGVTLGWVSGFFMYGGSIDKLEEQRQQIERDVFWYPAQKEDLRKKMWPELRKRTWFRYIEKMWSESDLRKGKDAV